MKQSELSIEFHVCLKEKEATIPVTHSLSGADNFFVSFTRISCIARLQVLQVFQETGKYFVYFLFEGLGLKLFEFSGSNEENTFIELMMYLSNSCCLDFM